jgi:acyl-coenzyme A synthetase/AMP-(fatty) acid ligase
VTSSWPKNIGSLFEHYADAERPVFHLDRPFDIASDEGTRYTPGDLARLVERTSGALHRAGLRSGDRLGIIKENHVDVIVLAAAAARIGAVAAMISATIRPEHLEVMLGRLRPRVLVAGVATLDAAESIGCTLADPGVSVIVTGPGTPPAGSLTFDDLREAPVPPAALRPDHEPMIYTHTSGTTGVPKLVEHSPDSMLGVIKRMEPMARLPVLANRSSDVMASCIAFVHGRAIAWMAQQLTQPPGAVVVLSDPDPESVAATLAGHRTTILDSCPNIFQRWEGLTGSHPQLFRAVRTFLNTFDAIHPRTVRKFLAASERPLRVWGQAWGQSETGPITMGAVTPGRMRRSSGATPPPTSYVGRPVPRVSRVRVVDPRTRRPVRRGREGIVLVKTRGQCLGYLGEDDRYEEKRWDGWWNTGDIGSKTRTGLIRLVDREVDIIPGMSGIAIESVLLERFDNATEVIVLGVPGRPPLPVVSTHDGSLDPADWRRAVAGLSELADPMLIRWEDFPRTGTWKVRRHELREQLLGTTQTYGTGRWT